MKWELGMATFIFLAVYGMLVWDRFNRAVVALLGASLMIFLGIISQEQAIEGVDFNTIGLLVGMMVIVAICRETGIFQYVAIKAAKVVRGEPWGIMFMLAWVTAVFSAFLDNVTTVLLIVPLTLLITEEMEMSPYPFLVVEVLASNIGGTATLIGDPPNIMIGSAVGLTFMDFVKNLIIPVVIVMVLTLGIIYLFHGRKMRVDERVRERIMSFDEKEALKDRVLLRKSLLVLGIVILGFVLQHHLHLEAATIALSGAALLLLITDNDLHETFARVEWTTIFFFTGLFVVVKGIEEAGLIDRMARWLMEWTQGDLFTTAVSVLWGSAVLSAFVDNIPFVATMIPLLKKMGADLGGSEAIMPLWWALSLGACLGGNGTLIGASANVVAAGIAEKEGHRIGFKEFMMVAFPLMLLSIVVSNVYIYLMYF